MFKFATAINCMDGRTQMPVMEFIKKKFDVDYVDMITEPGPNKILAEGKDFDTVKSIRKRVAVSVEKHGSNIIFIAAHYDCAGNPVDVESQKKQLIKAAGVIASWDFPVKLVNALWLDESFNPTLIKKL